MTEVERRCELHKPRSQIAEENGADAETIAWVKAREDEAPKIDPETAEVSCIYGQEFDPYDVISLPEEYNSVGWLNFARRPGSDIWVHFDDLPEATREAISNRPKRDRVPDPEDTCPF